MTLHLTIDLRAVLIGFILLLVAAGVATPFAISLADDEPNAAGGPSAVVGTAFTYQGRLETDGVPANGTRDFRFTLHSDAVANAPIGLQLTQTRPVTNGLFTAELDFGPTAFDGNARWLAVEARQDPNPFVLLTPRQALTPTPYALFALSGDPNVLQHRVSPGCARNSSIRTINSDGSVVCELDDTSISNPAWALTGNAGTVAGTNFIGTTDNVPFEVRVNGFIGFRVLPSSGTFGPNVLGGSAANSVTGVASGGTIGGGSSNTMTGLTPTIAGGQSNSAVNNFATVGGGEDNEVTAPHGTIAGGGPNAIGATGNRVTDSHGFVGGGSKNTAGNSNVSLVDAPFATVAGGLENTARATLAAVGGGHLNTASGSHATVGGGDMNTASGNRATVGGGEDNVVSAAFGTIAGGGQSDPGATIGNRVTDDYGTIGGGGSNTAGNSSGSLIDAQGATVAGGVFNTASDDFSAVGGGNNNAASGVRSTIGGGGGNTAGGAQATVPGGSGNHADGDFSFAAGRRATITAAGVGSFAWADSQDADFTVTRNNVFVVRAAGGVGINRAAPTMSLDVEGRSRFRAANDTNLTIGASGTQTNNVTLDLVKDIETTAAAVSARINFNGESGSTDHRGSIVFGTRDTADADVVNQIAVQRDGDLVPQRAGLDLGASTVAGRWQTVFAENALNTSDARLKKNIDSLEAGLAEVLRLQPRTFEWIESSQAGQHYGLIAQEVRDVLPAVVRGSESGDEVLAIAYNELTPVLIRAIQEQQAQIEALRGGARATANDGGSGPATWAVVAAAFVLGALAMAVARRPGV